MTDRMAALARADRAGPELAAKPSTISTTATAMGQNAAWFALQARSSTCSTPYLGRGHPPARSRVAFALNNPNKVRALIGAFVVGNPLHFHDQTGAGYQFLADQVIALNALNPQVAARLLPPQATWR